MNMSHFTKRLILLTALTLNLAAFTSCTNDDFAPQNALPEDGEIRISASVNQLVATRTETGTTPVPYSGSDLGLYIRPSHSYSLWEHNETNNKYAYPNVKFTNNTTGWSQTTYSPMLWEGDKVSYEYYAYAPYSSDVSSSNNKISYNLTSTAPTDLLWTSKTGLAKNLVNESQELEIEFGHVFCKVAVEIAIADEFYQNGSTDNPISNVTISSSSAKGYINVFTGNVYNNSENPTDNPTPDNLTFSMKSHTAGNSQTDGTYKTSDIFYAPGEEQFKVTITTTGGSDSRTFSYTHNETYLFESGKAYVIQLKMGKDVIQMSGAGITASAWANGGTTDLETE